MEIKQEAALVASDSLQFQSQSERKYQTELITILINNVKESIRQQEEAKAANRPVAGLIKGPKVHLKEAKGELDIDAMVKKEHLQCQAINRVNEQENQPKSPLRPYSERWN